VIEFVPVEGPRRYVVTVPGPLEPRVPTAEDRDKLRRMAESYDEAEHERIIRAAFPVPPRASP